MSSNSSGDGTPVTRQSFVISPSRTYWRFYWTKILQWLDVFFQFSALFCPTGLTVDSLCYERLWIRFRTSDSLSVPISLSARIDARVVSCKMIKRHPTFSCILLFLLSLIDSIHSVSHRRNRQIQFDSDADEFVGRELFRPFSHGTENLIQNACFLSFNKQVLVTMSLARIGIEWKSNRIRYSLHNKWAVGQGEQPGIWSN